MKSHILTEKHQLGIGGVAIGTAFENITDEQAHEILQAAWISESGIMILLHGTD